MTKVLLSFGSLFFALLITIVYFLKAKQANVDNKLYKMLLIFLNLTIISEILAIVTMYYMPDKIFLVQLFYKSNIILTNSLVVNIVFYIMMLKYKKEDKIIDYKNEIKNNISLKILLLVYVISVIASIFAKTENFSSSEGVYITGYHLYIMYIVGGISVLFGTISTIRSDIKISSDKRSSIIVGIVVSIAVMILQRIFPLNLMFACMFTFDTYILYYVFENPDLYLINELQKAKKSAEDSDKSKTNFLSNMTHEIKIPMNIVLNYSDEILSLKGNEIELTDIKDDLKHINLAGNSLLEVINNILDISKMEMGKEKLENIEYNIDDLVAELKSMVEVRINSKKVDFIIEIDPDMPRNLIGDRTKIFRIVLNLLSNAVKYTEVGKIKLKISFKNLETDKIILNLQIFDTGYGIKKEDHDKIFDKFTRLESATQNEIEGSGLGLVIVKRLVSLLDGKVWFESTYGAGSTFYVEVVQKLVKQQAALNTSENVKTNNKKEYLDCSNYKILLVDDNKLNLKVAEKILSNYKFQITSFDNGRACINSIKQGDVYDLIFLDHMMPEMDGIELLKILKKLKYFDIPPIVVLTANAIPGMKEMYLKEGFDEYLSKPINTVELDAVIKKYFENK